MKSAPKNLTVNFCNWVRTSRSKAVKLAWLPLRDCLLDLIADWNPKARIWELTEERTELFDQVRELQRENLFLHHEVEEVRSDRESIVKYLMAEKTRLTAINADLAGRLAAGQASTSEAATRVDSITALFASSPLYKSHRSAADALLN